MMADIKTRDGKVLTAEHFENDPKPPQTKAELDAKYSAAFLTEDGRRQARIRDAMRKKRRGA